MNTKSWQFYYSLQLRDHFIIEVTAANTALSKHSKQLDELADNMSMQELQEARHAYEESKS